MRWRWRRGCAIVVAVLVVVACGSEASAPPDVTSEPAARPTEPILPPDPPAIGGEPVAYHFELGAAAPSGYVATPTEGGYALEARDESGGARWSTTAQGARGDVQVHVERTERGVAVFVRADSGDFVDLIDDESGAMIGRTRLGPRVTRAPLEAPASASTGRPAWRGRWPLREAGVAWRGLEPRVRGMESAVAIVRGEGDEAFWTFRDPYGCIRLALVETERALVAAQYCEAASGAIVHALELEGDDGARERWIVRPRGLGSATHTARSNEIAITVDGDLVRVWGVEEEGRWVATLDLATGRELATLVERRR